MVVVGKGKLEDNLKKRVDRLQVNEIIKFVGFRDDVLSLVNSADIFVLSSDYEGMSNSLREAMAVGTACVATEVFGVKELFLNGTLGIMVKKGDLVQLFEGIKKLFDNPKLKNKLRKMALNY